MDLLFNTLSIFGIAFLLRSKHLLISWLQSLSEIILEPKNIKSVTASTLPLSICHGVKGLDAMILVFWMLSSSQGFHSPLSLLSWVSAVPLHFLTLEWYQSHMWGCWYFFGTGMNSHLFQASGHCWVLQICSPIHILTFNNCFHDRMPELYMVHKNRNLCCLALYRKCLLTSDTLNNFHVSLRWLKLKVSQTNFTILPLLHFLYYSCLCIFLLCFQCYTPSSFPRNTWIHIFFSILIILTFRSYILFSATFYLPSW